MSYFNYRGKKIYYEKFGKGEVLVFLHGNTASSKMFEPLMPLYADDFTVVLLDFMGNGKSERVERFPDEMWIDQGDQVIELCLELGLEKVNLCGTSGGAYAAVNAVLKRPELFNKVIADSFEGNSLHKGFAESVLKERKSAKKDEKARWFYEWCQGDDWEMVVDMDTEALVNYERKNIKLFHSPVETIKVPTLITAGREDAMIFNDMETECRNFSKANPLISYKIYDKGGHPLILSRAEDMAQDIKKFILG